MRKTLLVICWLWSFNDSIAIDNASLIQSSVMVVDLSHPKLLYRENSDLRLTPASTSKLFVAAAALRQLGGDYHFTTQIYTRGKLSNGILRGDLILYGMGDPMLANEQLWLLANQLKQLGLKSIEGNLIINKSYLGEVLVHSPDRIKARMFSDSAYEGLLSSVGSDFGTVGIGIFPTTDNEGQAHIAVTPFSLGNVSLVGTVGLSKNNDNPLVLTRQSKNNIEYLTISGSINKMSEPEIIYRSVGNPDVLTGNLFKGFLTMMEINFHGKIVVENVPLTNSEQLLTSVNSGRLIQLLQDMLYNSNNYMADMLTLDMWRVQQNKISSKTDLAIASGNLISEYQKLAKNSTFYDKKLGFPFLASGSGLTPNTKISAHDLIVLLDGMYQDRNNFSFLYGALPSFATTTHWLYKLNDSQLIWAKKLIVKTGSMGELPVLSMAGYFRLKNGDMAAFAIILNQEPQVGIKSVKQSQLPDEMLQKIQRIVAGKM